MTCQFAPDRLTELLRTDPFSPDDLLNELSRDAEFEKDLAQNVGVTAFFTLRTHTLRVMDCYEAYFASRARGGDAERTWFRLFLALHDIGKPAAIQAGDKEWQHRFTVESLQRTREGYPVTDREFNDWIALVNGDPLGAYLKGVLPAHEAGKRVRDMASRSSLEFPEFCRRMTIYYQCDVSAYTSRAGLIDALDGLFEWDAAGKVRFDEARGILVFSPRIRRLIEDLGPAAFNLGDEP